MTKCYRHGEICLQVVDKLPKNLTESKSQVLASGSHGNSHTFTGGKLYLTDDQINFGYLVAKSALLFHPEHSPDGVAIPDGIYKLIKQQEFTPEGLIPVID